MYEFNISDIGQIYWATVPGLPKGVLWPVQLREMADGRVSVFCHSDDAMLVLFFFLSSQLLYSHAQYSQIVITI